MFTVDLSLASPGRSVSAIAQGSRAGYIGKVNIPARVAPVVFGLRGTTAVPVSLLSGCLIEVEVNFNSFKAAVRWFSFALQHTGAWCTCRLRHW